MRIAERPSTTPPRPGYRITLAVILLGMALSWPGGNVGPVASEIAADFDLSLAVVGLLSGTLYLGAVAVSLPAAARFGAWAGRGRALRIGCLLLIGGNLVFALSPAFVGLAVGRILPGLAFTALNVLGAVWVREVGGARLLGVFGGAIQLGFALALLIGAGLSDLDVDWRVGFVVSAAVGAAALLALPRDMGRQQAPTTSMSDFVRIALRHARVYRLSLVFISIYGGPLIMGAWLVPYLVDEVDLATSLAGVAAFVMFGLSALVRFLGSKLQERGVPYAAICGTLVLASIGLGALAFDPVGAVIFAAVVLMAIGFAVPYATALIAAQRLDPGAPSEPVALMTLMALVPPMIAIPFVGHALDNGEGPLAFALVGAFVAVAALLNLRRTGIPVAGAADPA